MSLRGKHILLGVTGGIAAYKIPLLVRLLVKDGAEVRVMMTPAAREFVTPLTLSVVSRHPVGMDFRRPDGTWNNHVEWGRWADLLLVAPLTANTLAKIVNGQADNFLLTVLMSTEAPVWLAPAMDLEMYRYPAVQENLKKARSMGFRVFPAEYGELASGLQGQGRMPEPESLFEAIREYFTPAQTPWRGKKVLITAGPTYEHLDPVRFIGNHSSGKTGKALAEAFHRAGAEVTLIMGPNHVIDGSEPYKVVPIISAREMFEQVKERLDQADAAVFAAAVADYRPADKANKKIKKSGEALSLQLVPNPDILAYAGRHKKDGQIIVGFALETDRELENAREKLERKNADMIVLNSLRDPGAGFGTDTNRITVLHRDGKIHRYPLKDKQQLAYDIIHEMERYL